MSAARIIGGYWGMGDNVMQLPLVKQLEAKFSTVYLATPWPQLYRQFDNIRFLHPAVESPELYGWTHFRENIDAQPAKIWVAEQDVPEDAVRFHWNSGGDARPGAST